MAADIKLTPELLNKIAQLADQGLSKTSICFAAKVPIDLMTLWAQRGHAAIVQSVQSGLPIPAEDAAYAALLPLLKKAKERRSNWVVADLRERVRALEQRLREEENDG